MAIALSSAGVTLGYCVETTSGTRPTTGYTDIEGVKSIPDFNPAPSTLETTDLNQAEWKTYIAGLKDVGGALEFGFNLSTEFQTIWEALVTAAETAAASNKATWFEVKIPNFKSFYFAGMPSALGMSAISVDSVLEINAYILPSQIEGWAVSST